MLKCLISLLCFIATAMPARLPETRILPPVGAVIAAGERAALETGLAEVTQAFSSLPKKRENANAEIFLKAVRYALDLNEFFKPEDTGTARELLAAR